MNLNKNIVLLGMMGSGKSTIGYLLSKSIKLKFLDVDRIIEKKTGLKINSIFETKGEIYFRDLEEKVFCKLFEGEPHIISSGGGTILSAQSRQLISDRSYSIWLKSDIEKILSRINKKNERPLLSIGNPKEILNQKLIERKMFYSMADFHLENSETSIESLSIEIIEKLIREKVLNYE